jgi:transcriptional regulator with XRE-family HTH domain
MNETELHISRRVVAARQLRGISQDSLAQKLNVTREQVHQYESGQNLLSAGRLYEIARALRVNVSYFYEDLNGVPSTSCPYSLSEDRFKYLKNTMQRIAADHEVTATGHRKKLSRVAAINMAREVCEALGWTYSFGRDALFAHVASTSEAMQISHVASTNQASLQVAHVASTRQAVPASVGEER